MGCSHSKKVAEPAGGRPAAPDHAAPAEDGKLQAQHPAESLKAAEPHNSHVPGEASPVQAPVHAPSAPVIHGGENAPLSPFPAGDSKVDEHGRRKAPAATMPACFYKNGFHNGFKTIAEIPSLECDPVKWCAPWTLPPEALIHEPSPEATVTKFKNGDSERKIHNNTQLSASEIERLQGMRNEAKTMGVDFYPSVTSMATRFLSRARMDSRKAVKLMKDTQDWRKEYFAAGPITADSVLEDLKHGIVYFCGRDYALRPCIVIRAWRIPQKWYKDKCIDKFIRLLIFCMEYFLRYMTIPGRVENLSVLVDLATLGISQVPLGALGEVYKVMSHHYIGRVYKFYVVNISGTLSMIAGAAKAFLTDRQKQKLNMLDSADELKKEFALTQLETDLGGNRPIFKEFFPFPLLPGPFEAGYAGEPKTDTVPNAHECLSMAGAIGRLWDPKQSLEANRRVEYTPKAAEIMERCGFTVPPEARFDSQGGMEMLAGRSASAVMMGGHDGKDHATPETRETDAEGIPLDDNNGTEYDIQHDEVNDFGQDHVVETAGICGGSLFCCSA